MSTERFINENETLAISTYAGVVNNYTSRASAEMMVQITSLRSGQFVGLSMKEWEDLICFVRKMDREGKGITRYEV